jgi:hypothetical protein
MLKTRTGWNMEGRDVPADAQPAKHTIDRKKSRLFYSEAQTIPFKIRTNEDGSFVVN